MSGDSPASRAVRLHGLQAGLEPLPLSAAIAFAAAGGRPLELSHIGGDYGAGLSGEAVACLQAIAGALGGRLEGAETGSKELRYHPDGSAPGSAEVTSGVTPGVWLPAALPVLALEGRRISLQLCAPTHVATGPNFHELAMGWAPLVSRMGVAAELSLVQAGFSHDEAGRIDVCVHPSPRLRGVTILSRGVLRETSGISLVAGVGAGSAGQMRRRATERLRALGISAPGETIPLPSERARGFAFLLLMQFEHGKLALGAVGEPGQTPVDVVDAAVLRLEQLLSRRGALDGRAAQWLLIPAALAASEIGAPGVIGAGPPEGSRFTTAEVTVDLIRLAELSRAFLGVEVQIVGAPGDEGIIEVRPRPRA